MTTTRREREDQRSDLRPVLAQASRKYPEAGDALRELTESGKIGTPVLVNRRNRNLQEWRSGMIVNGNRSRS